MYTNLKIHKNTWQNVLDIAGELDSIPAIATTHQRTLQANISEIDKKSQLKDSQEVDMYLPIAIMLNTLSKQCATKDNAIVFYISSDGILPGDAFDLRIKPDIAVKSGDLQELTKYLHKLEHGNWGTSDPCRPNHHECRSAIEIKTKDLVQAMIREVGHLNGIKRSLPHSRLIHGMSARFSGYVFYKLTACEVTTTYEMKWDTEGYLPLLAFVRAMYAADRGLDPRFKCSTSNRQIWEIEVPAGDKITVIPIYSSPAPGRMTWVGTGFTNTPSPQIRVVKLSWVEAQKRQTEEYLYEVAHSRGWIPGLARPVCAIEFEEQLSGPANHVSGLITRNKQGILLGSTGDPLSQCESILEFLMVMYDTIETLEEMNKNGVLHRDLSWTNVLCHPRHGYIGDKKLVSLPYIDNVLNSENPRCRCLVTDLDHATTLDSDNNSSRLERTGTPMFIAIEVANGNSELWPANLALDILSLRRLIKTFSSMGTESISNEHLNHLKSLADKLSSILDPDMNLTTVETFHQPLHDGHSMFWIMAFFLARANPETSTEAEPPKLYNEFCNRLLRHSIGDEDSYRTTVTRWELNKWEKLLHPDLQGLAPMLHGMAQYISISWAHYDIDDLGIKDNHAYHAIKALLLREIKRMSIGDPIKLTTDYPRPAYHSLELEQNYRTSGSNRGIALNSQLDQLKDAQSGLELEAEPEEYLAKDAPADWGPTQYGTEEKRAMPYLENCIEATLRAPQPFLRSPRVKSNLQSAIDQATQRAANDRQLHLRDEVWFSLTKLGPLEEFRVGNEPT